MTSVAERIPSTGTKDGVDGAIKSFSLLDLGKDGFPSTTNPQKTFSPTSGTPSLGDQKDDMEDDGTPVYQWQDDDGVWQYYDEMACGRIQEGYEKWQAEGSQLFVDNTIDIIVDGNVLIIEFVNMTQTCDITGRFRRIRNKADCTKPCKWGDACTNADCHFAHPSGADRRGMKDDARGKIPCRWGEYCTRANCPFIHPKDDVVDVSAKKPCKYGDECWEPSCDSAHPGGESRSGLIVNKNKHCRYGDNCTRIDCRQRHPNGVNRKGMRCKFGDMCRRPQCERKHPNDMDRIGLDIRNRNGPHRPGFQRQRSATNFREHQRTRASELGRPRTGSLGDNRDRAFSSPAKPPLPVKPFAMRQGGRGRTVSGDSQDSQGSQTSRFSRSSLSRENSRYSRKSSFGGPGPRNARFNPRSRQASGVDTFGPPAYKTPAPRGPGGSGLKRGSRSNAFLRQTV